MFFLLVILSANYALYNGPVGNNVSIYKDRKYVLVNNNILINDEEYNNKITKIFHH